MRSLRLPSNAFAVTKDAEWHNFTPLLLRRVGRIHAKGRRRAAEDSAATPPVSP